MDFSYENERLVLTINCLQELDDIVKETEKRPKKVIVKNGARLTMTKIQQYFRSAMMSEVEEIEIVGGWNRVYRSVKNSDVLSERKTRGCQRCGWDFVGQWVGFSGLQKH